MLLESFVFALAAVFVGDALWERFRATKQPQHKEQQQQQSSFQWGWFQLGNKLAVLGFIYSSAMMFKHGGSGQVNTVYFGVAIACLAYFFTFFGVSIIRQLTADQVPAADAADAKTKDQERTEPAAGKWGHLKLQAVRDMLCLVGRVTSDAETPYKHVLWRLTRNDKQGTVWSTHAPGSSSGIVRAVCKLPVPVETVLNILIDDSRLPDYDSAYEGQDFVEKVDSHTFLRRVRYKGQWGVQARDFILLTTWCRLEDGTYLIASRSAPNEVWPTDQNYVRGNVLVSGYHIAPLRGNPEETELTLVAHADLTGTLPRVMVEALLNTTPLELVAKVQELAMMDVSHRKLVSPLIKAPTLNMESRANLRAEGEDALFQLKTLHSQTESGKRNWNLVAEYVGVSVYESPQKDSAWDMLRGTCVVQASPNAVRDLLVENYRKVNPLVATTQVLDRVHEDYAVVWAGTADLWPAGCHDFLMVTGVKALKAGGFVLAARSTSYRMAPSSPTFKRGRLRLGGYVVTPTKSGHSTLTAYLHLDSDGYVPGWFNHMFCETAFPAHLCHIRAACRPDLPPVVTPNFQDAINRVRAKEKKMAAFANTRPTSGNEENAVQFKLVLNQIANTTTTPSKKRSGKDDTASDSGRRAGSASRPKSDAPSEVSRRSRADSTTSASGLSSSPAPSRVRKPLFARNTSAPSEQSKTETGSMLMLEGDAMTINEEADAAAMPPLEGIAAKYGDLFGQIAQEAMQLLAAFANVEGHPHDPQVTEPLQWREAANRKGVKVASAPFKDSAWSVLRSETVFRCSPEDIMRIVTDDERLKEFDDMFDRYELLDESNPHGRVRRFMFKAVWPTAPRDFIVLTTHKKLENGCYMVATRSVANDVFPEESRFTRGKVLVSGYYLKPVAEGTEIIMCAHTDLGGTLPSTIINMLSTSAPIQLLNNLRRLCQSG